MTDQHPFAAFAPAGTPPEVVNKLNAAMQKAYDLYSFNVIPVMGQIIANDRDSYQYLVESSRQFPDQESFAAMIRTAGFEQVKFRNLTMGVAALHSGWKL